MPTTQYIKYPNLGGGSVSIGTPIGSGTPGSVLFIDNTGSLGQSNANFFFNQTTHALSITGPFSASNFSGTSTGTNTGDVTLGTANGLSLVGQVLSLALSSASTVGALNATDWNTFNNKQSAGSYVTTSEVGAANGVASLDSAGKVPIAQLPSAVLQYEGAWNPSTNTPTLSDGTGTNGFVYYVTAAFAGPISGLTDPSMVNFQIGDLTIYSSSIGKWQLTTPAAGVSSVNGLQGAVIVNAINQLTADVTAGPASQSQSKAATIAAIQGNTVSGTTGTGNVVFSASPTLTGTLTASIANFSGAISASNFSGSSSGSNTGDQTITLTGDVTGSGTGSFATTLATVNSNVGGFGSSTSIPSFTVNAKGLITAASGNVVIAPAGTLTGTTLNSSVVTSSLTSLGIQSSALNMGSNLINSVTDPVSPQDAATKAYVDSHATTGGGFMGSINWAATGGAEWTAQSGSFVNMTVTGTPPTPTVTNKALDPGSHTLGVKFANMPAGAYRFVGYGKSYEIGGNQGDHGLRFSDGTTATNAVMMTVTNAAGLSFSTIEGVLIYGSPQTNVTIQIQGLSPSTDTVVVDIQAFSYQIDVYYFPLA